MTALNKADLLATFSTAPALHTVDGVGDLYFKKLSIAEQGALTKKAKDTDDVQASLYMVAYSLCDEQGKRLFGDKDVDELGKMSATQMTAIVNVINHINGFDIAQDALKKN